MKKNYLNLEPSEETMKILLICSFLLLSGFGYKPLTDPSLQSQQVNYADNCNPYSNTLRPAGYCLGRWTKICVTHPNGYSKTSQWVCMR
jgi:hypothetical protein